MPDRGSGISMKKIYVCFAAALFNLFIFGMSEPHKWVGVYYKTGVDKVMSIIGLKYFFNAYLINIFCFIILCIVYKKIKVDMERRHKIIFFIANTLIFGVGILMYIASRGIT